MTALAITAVIAAGSLWIGFLIGNNIGEHIGFLKGMRHDYEQKRRARVARWQIQSRDGYQHHRN